MKNPVFSNETSSENFLHGTIHLVCSSSKLKYVDEILCCYHLMKPLQQYFHIVLIIEYVVLVN